MDFSDDEKDKSQVSVDVMFAPDLKSFTVEFFSPDRPLEIDEIGEILESLSTQMRGRQFSIFGEDETVQH